MLRWSKKDCSSLCPPERKTATIVEYSFSSWRDSVFLQEFTKWSYSLASSLVAVQLKKRARKSEMQLLRRCLSIVLIYTTLVAIQQLALAQEPNEVERLREEQTKVGCMLKYNETLRAEFYYNIGNSQDTRISRFAEGYDDNVRCWAIRYCPDAPVSWCVHLYHPEKSIELCYNNTGHVTRTTEAAAALMLQEKFQMQPELCHTRWPSCIRTISPDAFLSYSYLSCTAESDTCYKQTFSAFEVVGSGDTINPPEFAFSSSSSDMFLKETNILRCDISVPARLYVLGLQSGWKINGVRFKTDIPQHPNCGIDPSLSLDSDECSSAFDNTEELRQKRVRQYRLNHLIKTCPFATVLIHIWLVVENASLEDVAATYACYGEYVIHNPVQTPLVAEEILHVNPVYPLLNVTFMETPHIQSNLSYHPEPSETLQWNCSVQAGLGDRLVWMLNKKELLHIDIDNLIPTENLNCSSVASYNSDSIVVSEIKELGQFERQFTSTLLICQITELTAGFYECVVNRTWRGDDRSVRVWSAMLVSSTSTTTLPESANVHTITGHLMIIISVSVVTSFIVVVFVLVTIITLCVRHGQSRKPSRAVWELAMGNISVTDDILTEFRRKNSLKKEFVGPSLEHQDPMEFPRNRLILLDRVLGEGTFGLVRQARAEGIVESTPERNIVAVKTTRAKAPPQEMNNFWEELQLMKNMVPHGNIVNLLGHCTTPGGPIYMIIEYANHGSLKDFLKMCEEAVLKLNHIPQIQQSFRSRRTSSANTGSSSYPHLVFKLPLSAQNSVFSTTSTPTALIPPTPDSNKFDFSSTHYQNIRLATEDSGFFGENGDQAAISDALGGALTAHSVAPLTHNYVNSKGLLYMEDVQNFALQIACGLKHLEDIQIVHCDLAARNILIAEGFVLKIGDFGMARDVSEKEYYRKQGGRVPVKWTAPEALMDHIFTFKSDIWSFGVILWEIFTYGQQPYHKFKIHHSWEPFINHLMEGKRLEQPKGCPDAFYTLMQSCWHSSPNQRPTADDLVQILSQTNLLDEEDGLTGSDSGTQLSIESCADIDACVHIPQETQV